MKKIKKFLFILLITCLSSRAYAALEISEIMYDLSGTDTDREWVEVYNSGPDNIDLSKWYFFSDNTKHTLTPDGSSTISGGGYAVIVQNVSKFRMDWPNFSGLLFDSSWTGFNNESGETIALKDPEQNIVGTTSFSSSQGANGDGNSLQKINGSFVASFPTPGNVNSSDNNNSNNTNQNNTQNTQNDNGDEPTANKAEQVKPAPPRFITTKIVVNPNVTAKVGFKITANTIGYDGESLTDGKFVWSFGDGMSVERATNQPFEYLYEYPGQYVLTLTYYYSIVSKESADTDQITINVISPSVSITRVGTYTDPFFEIKNESGSNVLLSGWSVKSANNKIFKMPEGMTILPNKTVKFSSKVTGFDINDIAGLSLMSPSWEVINTYPTIKQTDYPKQISEYNPNNYTNSLKEDKTQIDLNSLSASASNAKTSNNYLPTAGLVSLILFGIISVSLVRKKSSPRVNSEIEEDLTSADIRIIE